MPAPRRDRGRSSSFSSSRTRVHWGRDDPRTIGIITGSVLAITGALVGAISFTPTPYEQAWEKYEVGPGPDDSGPTAQVSPLVGPNLAGLSVAGSFF